MRRFSILFLLSLLLTAGAVWAVEPSAEGTAPADEATAPAATPEAVLADEGTAPALALCLLDGDRSGDPLTEVFRLYECPQGVPYCRVDSQCAGFCGPGPIEFGVCYRGCCSCLG